MTTNNRLCHYGFLIALGMGGCEASSGEDTDVMMTTGTSGNETETGTPETDTEDTAANQCNAQIQDCPDGQKCTARDNNQGQMPGWNENVCVSLKGDKAAGDACDVVGNPFTGDDECDVGLICLQTDENGQNGVCTPFCDENNECENGICVEANDGVLNTCLQLCDPLLQDCPDVQGCYGDPEFPAFVCFVPDTSGTDNNGNDGSSCSFTNNCQPGLYCAPQETQDGCTAELGCCTPYCPLDDEDPGCSSSIEQCIPFFADPPLGFENVGICVIPG